MYLQIGTPGLTFALVGLFSALSVGQETTNRKELEPPTGATVKFSWQALPPGASDESLKLLLEDSRRNESIELDLIPGRSWRGTLPLGDYAMSLPEEDAWTVFPNQLELKKTRGAIELELGLFARGNLNLQVVGFDGSSLGKKALRFVNQEIPSCSFRTRCDESGWVRLDDVPSGTYSVECLNQGWSLVEVNDGAEDRFVVKALPGRASAQTIVLREDEPRVFDVSLSLSVDGRDAKGDEVRVAYGIWRGCRFTLAAQGNGLYRAQFRAVEPQFEIGDPIDLFVHGNGFPDQELRLDGPGAKSDTVRIEHSVQRWIGQNDAILLDDFRRPLPGREVELELRFDAFPGSIQTRRTVTDSRGRFTIESVTHPVRVAIVNAERGARFLPNGYYWSKLQAGDVLKAARLQTNSLSLEFPPGTSAALVESDRWYATTLHLLATSQPEHLSSLGASGQESVHRKDCEKTESGGLLANMGPLAVGNYEAIIFSLSGGTVNGSWDIRSRSGAVRKTCRFEKAESKLTGTLRDAPGNRNVLVVDGKIPPTMINTVARILMREEAAHSDCVCRPAIAISRVGADGAFSLAAHNALNPHVTFIVPGRGCFYAPKEAVSRGTVGLVPGYEGCLVRGQVLASDGEPVVGALVNLTGLHGEGAPAKDAPPKPSHLCGAITDTEGRYELHGMPRGEFALCVTERFVDTESKRITFEYLPESRSRVAIEDGVNRIDIALSGTGVDCAPCGGRHASRCPGSDDVGEE